MLKYVNKIYILILLVSVIGTFLVTALLVNIFEKKEEGKNRFVQVVPIGEYETDPAVWGHNFPDEYDTWRRTTENYGDTEFGGSGKRDKLAENPRLKTLYGGYPFSIEYNDERGHGWSIVDVVSIKRLGDKKPGTCFTCKSSDNVRMWHEMGAEKFYLTPMKELVMHAKNPISCLNCHDPKTMELRPANPAFLEAMKERGVDISAATRQEMRSYVCGQCHVEYYFETKEKPVLHFPWKNGLALDDIEKYYDDINFYDWTHPDSGTDMIKMQHPDFELWSTGIHSRSGVACADCHMPFKRIGSQKISNHWVRSPLMTVNASCQSCHRWNEQELKQRVSTIQRRTRKLMDQSEIAIIDAINAIKAAKDAGVDDTALVEAKKLHRRAQMRWDFVSSENSMGFHSPQESARLLAEAIDFARQAQITAMKALEGKGKKVSHSATLSSFR